AGDRAPIGFLLEVEAARGLDARVPGGAHARPVVLGRGPVVVTRLRIVVVDRAIGVDHVLLDDGDGLALVAFGRGHLDVVLQVDPARRRQGMAVRAQIAIIDRGAYRVAAGEGAPGRGAGPFGHAMLVGPAADASVARRVVGLPDSLRPGPAALVLRHGCQRPVI